MKRLLTLLLPVLAITAYAVLQFKGEFPFTYPIPQTPPPPAASSS